MGQEEIGKGRVKGEWEEKEEGRSPPLCPSSTGKEEIRKGREKGEGKKGEITYT